MDLRCALGCYLTADKSMGGTASFSSDFILSRSSCEVNIPPGNSSFTSFPPLSFSCFLYAITAKFRGISPSEDNLPSVLSLSLTPVVVILLNVT